MPILVETLTFTCILSYNIFAQHEEYDLSLTSSRPQLKSYLQVSPKGGGWEFVIISEDVQSLQQCGTICYACRALDYMQMKVCRIALSDQQMLFGSKDYYLNVRQTQ